ncbi:hypothetical protein V7117_26185, partial [Bacillus pseudomycoides]
YEAMKKRQAEVPACRFARSLGFQSLRHASRTIKGIETLHAIYKQRRSLQSDSVFSTNNELQNLLSVS